MRRFLTCLAAVLLAVSAPVALGACSGGALLATTTTAHAPSVTPTSGDTPGAPTTSVPEPTSTTTEAKTPDQIAFVKEGGSQGDGIWLVNADGTDARLLTDKTGSVGQIVWSKDGGRLAILSGAPTADNWAPSDSLWVMSADGSDLRQVKVTMPAKPQGLSGGSFNACDWSPDGSELALTVSYPDDASSYGDSLALVVLDVASGKARFLNGSTEDLAWGDVSFTPDGSTILVLANSEDAGWLNAIDPSTGALAAGPSIDSSWAGKEYADFFLRPFAFALSADGSQIASLWGGYDYQTQTGSPDFLVVSASTGADARELLRSTENERANQPSWSPSGKSLAFAQAEWDEQSQSWVGGKIAVAPVDGSGARVELVEGRLPAWRPTGAF